MKKERERVVTEGIEARRGKAREKGRVAKKGRVKA